MSLMPDDRTSLENGNLRLFLVSEALGDSSILVAKILLWLIFAPFVPAWLVLQIGIHYDASGMWKENQIGISQMSV